MTQPRRRPLQRDDLDIERALRQFLTVAPEWELGWSVLRAEMRDAGWPSRTPEGDRKPSTGPSQHEPSSLDYNDPCGDMAMRFNDLSGDLEALQDHWHVARSSLRAIAAITRRHIPAHVKDARMQCYYCDDEVEKTANGNYRGMERIAGLWIAKTGVRPTCARHRKANERAA